MGEGVDKATDVNLQIDGVIPGGYSIGAKYTIGNNMYIGLEFTKKGVYTFRVIGKNRNSQTVIDQKVSFVVN